MSDGSEFHATGPASEKARSPNLVRSLGVTHTCTAMKSQTGTLDIIMHLWTLYRAQFEVDPPTNRQPVELHQARCYMVTSVQMIDQTRCSILDSLQRPER